MRAPCVRHRGSRPLALWLGWQIGHLAGRRGARRARSRRPPPSSSASASGGWFGLGPEREVEWSGSPARASRATSSTPWWSPRTSSSSPTTASRRRELRAALEEAWEEKALPRGASTITQQLAKNLWLSPSRNPLRKVKEAILTWQLERELSKRRILELYLNVVEFGPGIYGAEAAGRHYFGKSARSLTERQAAQLAAGLPRPRSWHPGKDSRAYRRKVRTIERRMGKASWVRRHL